MIKLNEIEVCEVILKSLKSIYPSTNISDVRLLDPDVKKMEYNAADGHFYLDASKQKSIIMAYHNGFHDAPLSIEQIKYHIKKYFINSQHISVELIVNHDKTHKPYPKGEELKPLIDFRVEIYFDHQTNLDQKDINCLIDLALEMKDEAWFKELSSKYKKLKEV